MRHGTCASCAEERPLKGRGLCNRCYQRARKAGRLDEFDSIVRHSIAEWLDVIDTSDAAACWPWPGALHRKGYGLVNISGCPPKAHRAVYEHMVRPLGSDEVLDHLCHKADECRAGDRCPHRRCVNPAHLGVTTALLNSQRSNSERDVCKNGLHVKVPENTYVHGGKAYCRPCHLAKAKVHKRAQRAAARRERLAGEVAA